MMVSCSPSSLTPISARLVSLSKLVVSSAFGGYPYFTSKSGTDVFSEIAERSSPQVALSDIVTEVAPEGPRIRRRIAMERNYALKVAQYRSRSSSQKGCHGG